MIEIQETIKKLVTLMQNEINEDELLKRGNILIENLRVAWKKQKIEFTQEFIDSLKRASAQLEAVSEFIEEERDFKYIDNVDDADEIIGRLYPLFEITEGMAVTGRIHKEIRQLVENKQTLPSKLLKQEDNDKNSLIRTLNANAPTCKHKNCGSKMVIRKGSNAYFWGCSSFPKCWSKQWLKHEGIESSLAQL